MLIDGVLPDLWVNDNALGVVLTIVPRTTPALRGGVMGIGMRRGTPHRLTPCGYV